MSKTRRIALGALALLAACLLAHGPALSAGFVYDDHRFIVHNESIRSLDLGGALTDASTASHGAAIQHDIYRPLRTMLFMLEWALFGDAPGPWHVVSLLLHVGVAILLWRWLARLVPDRELLTLLASAVVMLHPVTLESVAWVSSQGDLLAMVLGLLALRAWAEPGLRRTLAGTALFTLACLSKESALALPALLVLQHAVLSRQRGEPFLSRALATRVGACVAVIAGYLLLRHQVLGVWAQVDDPLFDVPARARGMLAGLGWYAQTLVWPDSFTFDYRFDLPVRWSDPRVVLGLGLIASAVWAAVAAWRRGAPRVVLATLGFFALLIPVSNVIVPLKTFVADRFLYPSLLPLALGIALLLLLLSKRSGRGALAVAGVLAVALGAVTHARADAWQSERSLWEAVRHDQPSNANAYYGLAYEYAKVGRVKEAYRYFESYVAANPVDGKAWLLLGNTFGDLADSLYLRRQEEGVRTDIDLRRRQARGMQVQCYRQTFDIWTRYGFARGRGSPELLRVMLARWFRTAVRIGDIAEARFANNAALRQQGIDPEDPGEVAQRASWSRQARRWALAEFAAKRALPRDLPGDQKNEIYRRRALVLRDVGLDPRKLPAQVWADYLVAFGKAIDAAGAAGKAIDADSLLNLALGLVEDNQLREAARRIEQARAVNPRHPRIGEVQRSLGAKRAGGAG